jgi:hypothetical protein
MDGLGPFRYILDETEESFFQETAEGIAKTAADTAMVRFVKSRTTGRTAKQLAAAAKKRKAKVKAPKAKELTESQRKQILANTGATSKPSKAVKDALEYAGKGGYLGHGSKCASARTIKLATLIKKASEEDLVKQAGYELFSGNLNSYEKLASVVAVASPYEPLGMTSTAYDYLEDLEKIGCDDEELGILANSLIGDALQTDALIESVLLKQAGAEEDIWDIYDGLQKVALAAAATHGLGLLRQFGARGVARLAGSSLARGAKAVGRGAKASWRQLRDVGVRGTARQAGRAVAKPFVKAKRGAMAKLRTGAQARRATAIKGLQSQRTKLRSQLAAGMPESQAMKVRTDIGNITKDIQQRLRTFKATGRKQIAARRAAGLAPAGTAPTAAQAAAKAKTTAKASAAEGARKAEGAARKAEGAAGKAKAPSPESDLGAFRAWKKKNPEGSYSEFKKATGGAGAAKAAPKDTGKGPKWEERPAAGKPAPGAPSPQSPPKGAGPESVKDAPGYGDIYKKWNEGGWKALSDAEKRKVYVGAGVAFVGQRAVMDKPII